MPDSTSSQQQQDSQTATIDFTTYQQQMQQHEQNQWQAPAASIPSDGMVPPAPITPTTATANYRAPERPVLLVPATTPEGPNPKVTGNTVRISVKVQGLQSKATFSVVITDANGNFVRSQDAGAVPTLQDYIFQGGGFLAGSYTAKLSLKRNGIDLVRPQYRTFVINNSQQDTTRPSIKITAPANGAKVSGTKQVTVNASDNVGVTKVEYRLNNATAAFQTVTNAPFSFNWNSTTVSNGRHVLRARAYDAAGNIQNTAIEVVVQNGPTQDTTRPSITITAPANGAKVGGTKQVTVNASDNVGVTKVEYRLDGVAAPFQTSTNAPFTINWDTTKVTNGEHVLKARAYDAAGNTRDSQITVVIQNAPTREVRLTNPRVTSLRVNSFRTNGSKEISSRTTYVNGIPNSADATRYKADGVSIEDTINFDFANTLFSPQNQIIGGFFTFINRNVYDMRKTSGKITYSNGRPILAEVDIYAADGVTILKHIVTDQIVFNDPAGKLESILSLNMRAEDLQTGDKINIKKNGAAAGQMTCAGTSCKGDITNISLNAENVIDFSAVNKDGQALQGSAQLKFTPAKIPLGIFYFTDGLKTFSATQQLLTNSLGQVMTLRDPATFNQIVTTMTSSTQNQTNPLTGVNLRASIQFTNAASALDAQTNMAVRIKSPNPTIGPIYLPASKFNSTNMASISTVVTAPTVATTYTFELYDYRTGQVIKTSTATYAPPTGGGNGDGNGNGNSNGNGNQTTPPTIAISFPANNGMIGSNVWISGTVTSRDSRRIGRIVYRYTNIATNQQFSIGADQIVRPPQRQVSLAGSWNASSLARGQYRITVTVYDANGKTMGQNSVIVRKN